MQEASKLTLGDGRYELLELIGEGGMARVWKAYDNKLHVHCAIKVILGEGRAAEVRGRRLLNEARAMMRTRHAGIVRVHQIVDDDGPPYIVMDMVQGGTLQQQLDATGGASGLPARQVCAWMLEVLAALAAAHNQGVVHRDIKPSNILLDEEGHALLADFGIALLLDEDRHTRTHIAMGSVLYMAPEQRMDARAVGPTADLYAVASTAYHLLTAATPVDLCMADGASPRWEAVPEALRGVLIHATRHDPEQRYPSAAEMATALMAAAAQLPEDPDGPVAVAPRLPTPDPLTWVGTMDAGTTVAPTRSLSGPLVSLAVALAVMATLLGAGLWWTTPARQPDVVVEAPAWRKPIPAPPPVAEVVLPEGVPAPSETPVRAEPAPVRKRAAPAKAVAQPVPEPADMDPTVALYAGRWTGTHGPLLANLTLSGLPEAVTGTLVTSIGGDEATDAATTRIPVKGRFDSDGPRLVLNATSDTVETAEINLRYDAQRVRWTGTVARRHGTLVATVVFMRP